MTLVLAPDIEQRLRTVAVGQGLPPEEALRSLLDRALAEAEAELENVLADLQASEADFAAGRSMTVEELRLRLRERRQVVTDRLNSQELAARP